MLLVISQLVPGWGLAPLCIPATTGPQNREFIFAIILGQSRKGGAGGGSRTPTGLPLLDFESSASTSFTTPAHVRAIN